MTTQLPEQWKKLTAAIVIALFIYLNKKLGFGLDETTISQIALIAVSYIVGQGLADFGKNAAAITPAAPAVIVVPTDNPPSPSRTTINP